MVEYKRRVFGQSMYGHKREQSSSDSKAMLHEKVPNNKRRKKEAEKALRSLIVRGCEMNYELTDDGLAFCHKIACRRA